VHGVTEAGMSAPEFEQFGDAARIGANSRFECRICWYVYDPAEGDVVWQIPAGTPFRELPPHWSCPNCSATKDQFLVLSDA
jgi:rubredoxin